MSIEVRRVVTGHDSDGRAVVLSDGIARNVISARPGQERCLLWMTDTLPVRNDGDEDMGDRVVGVGQKGGSVFGVLRIEPGCQPRMHRTLTADFGIILEGSIVLELDDSEVELKAGDVFVQRGTVHAWHNRGDVPCVFAVTMIDADPVTIAGRTLEEDV